MLRYSEPENRGSKCVNFPISQINLKIERTIFMSKKKLAIDMTPEELEQWLETLEIEDTVPSYYFSNPDPYFKVSPSANEKPQNYWFGEDGHIHVKNISAYWIPELTLTKEIKGTIYTVSGSYEGTETFVCKLERMNAEKFTEILEEQE